jgi:hypothetical protein
MFGMPGGGGFLDIPDDGYLKSVILNQTRLEQNFVLEPGRWIT